MREIFRTVYQIEVFSEGPFQADGGDDDPFDLMSINTAIVEGDAIGSVELLSSEVVPPAEVEGHLTRIGNDGGFFDELD